MTVIWHVDDLKVSHVDENENSKIAEWTKTVHRGKNHDYLGMDMDWSKDGKVTIGMIKYF